MSEVISAILSYLSQMILPAVFGLVLWCAVVFAWQRVNGAPPRHSLALLLLFMYISGLLALTLTPQGFWSHVLNGEAPFLQPPFSGGVNLIPLRNSIRLGSFYARQGMWAAIAVNFLGNIVMFLPVGFFPAYLMDKPRWWKSALCALGLSLFIELFQLFVSRGTDIDDLILNSLGGLMGHWLYIFLFRKPR